MSLVAERVTMCGWLLRWLQCVVDEGLHCVGKHYVQTTIFVLTHQTLPFTMFLTTSRTSLLTIHTPVLTSCP